MPENVVDVSALRTGDAKFRNNEYNHSHCTNSMWAEDIKQYQCFTIIPVCPRKTSTHKKGIDYCTCMDAEAG